jgi:hypothetical protein
VKSVALAIDKKLALKMNVSAVITNNKGLPLVSNFAEVTFKFLFIINFLKTFIVKKFIKWTYQMDLSNGLIKWTYQT